MSGWTVPPKDATPPKAGAEPPPGVAMPYQPEEADPERAEQRARWAEAAEDADRDRTDDELKRDARHTREALSSSVGELRHRFGMDEEAAARRQAATGPMGPVRRHPFTVAAAAAGATTAALVGVRIAHRHRRAAKRREKDVARRLKRAKKSLASVSPELAPRRHLRLRS